MELDWSVGEIVKTLKEEGIYDHTLFIFTSDNGPRVGSAKPLRGLKAETWEGGQRVPCIMAWPDVIPAGKVCKELVSTLDLYPTFAEFKGSEIPDYLSLDGTDIGELLQDPENTRLPERPFYFYARNGEAEAVRLGKWKLHIKKSIGWDAGEKGVFPVSLYNLHEDVEEQNNVADKYPDIVNQLTELIDEFDEI
jgi:arylsulfatase A-like enzyme